MHLPRGEGEFGLPAPSTLFRTPLCCREATPARTFSDDYTTSTTDDEVLATLYAELKNWSQQVYSVPLNPESGRNKTE